MKILALLRRRRKREQELDEEIRAHLAMAVRERIEQGEDPTEAELNARREFGNVPLVKDVTRDMWGWCWLETLLQDVKYGLRQLRRDPVFTAVAVLTLAIGIGANTAMFSVVSAVLLRPLPFRHPGRVVAIEGIQAIRSSGRRNQIEMWRDLVGRRRTLEEVSFYATGGINLSGNQQPQHLPAAIVSANFFQLLGVGAVLGRTFLPQEDTQADAVAVISFDLWKGHFAADRRIVGKQIELARRPFTVVGVMPQGFEFPGDTQIWIPGVSAVNAMTLFGQQGFVPREIARLRPGVTALQARNELSTFLGHTEQNEHGPFPGENLSVVPIHVALAKDIRPSLLVLMGAVGLVLLIACADVANLQMARNAGRLHEIAVRAAVGASRARLVRQLLTESLILALLGGATGILLAQSGVWLARAIIPTNEIPVSGIRLDMRVLIFTLAIAVLTGIVSGLLPALRTSKAALNGALKEAAGGKSRLGWANGFRLRAAIGSVEIALALTLFIGAGLLVRSLVMLNQVNPGFRADHLLTARLFLTAPGYDSAARRAAFFGQLLGRANKLPGVKKAALANSIPMGGGMFVGFRVGIEGSPTRKPETFGNLALYFAVSPDFFRTMGIPLVAGREFGARDRPNASPVVAVSQTAARQFWPKENPIGKRVTMFAKWMTVVGVVGDVRHYSLSEKPWPAIYVPIFQQPPASAFLVLNTTHGVSASDIGRVVHSVDRGEPVASVRTGEELLSRVTADPRFRAEVTGIFAALALLLAVIGIYGVLAYSVRQRTHEIGIRMALGAERGDVLKMVVWQGLKLALIGVAIGIAGALALTRFLSSLLYGVKPTDPLTFIAVSMILIAVALLACYIPARRAARVDPMVALRYE